MPAQVKNKVCLIVHDGWGIATEPGLEGNAIEAGTTTNMDRIGKEHSQRRLAAHGTAVGLSDGLMGNSEVGHLNIGAGRVVWQDIVRIDVAIKKKTFHKNETILSSFKHAKDGNGRLHLMGLISDGGVHSHNTHLYALLETAKEQGVPETYVHFFGDGRDTAPRSAAGYCQELLDFMKKEEYGELATVVGRYYAMDRDKRWERVKIAVDGLVGGEGAKLSEGKGAVDEIKANYEKDVTDEFLKPIIVNGDAGRIKDGDTLFFFNYRSDRMRELVTVLGLPEKPMEVTVPKDLHITTMSRYNTEFPFPVAFPPQAMTNVLAGVVGGAGCEAGACCCVLLVSFLSQTEKYAHVTFFFNGGVEKQFENEERFMIPSPKVATYDLQPEMSVQGVADKVASVVKSKEYDFVMCNFAPPDMVGHTGKYDAAVSAITHTDAAVGTVYDACQAAGYILLITADHGNAEQMRDAKTGAPHTAHTCNPVPFILAGNKADGYALVQDEEKKTNKDGDDEEEGALCDVAPTVLDLMGLPKPEEMTGRSLLANKPEGKYTKHLPAGWYSADEENIHREGCDPLVEEGLSSDGNGAALCHAAVRGADALKVCDVCWGLGWCHAIEVRDAQDLSHAALGIAEEPVRGTDGNSCPTTSSASVSTPSPISLHKASAFGA
ncbi:Phosphoglycerate-bisphosphoglycerate-independent [Mycena venus]|uniref:2,3-bisphosphoglycerate-independent phosphoglycerate mutase n=1 Tax=Mycena venus TaxID=2733690 RepID=A0A8H6YZL8_9AGAR|nr:Phosphoglycerate-bisphosphoglycerate-independent [Mycena venus]